MDLSGAIFVRFFCSVLLKQGPSFTSTGFDWVCRISSPKTTTLAVSLLELEKNYGLSYLSIRPLRSRSLPLCCSLDYKSRCLTQLYSLFLIPLCMEICGTKVRFLIGMAYRLMPRKRSCNTSLQKILGGMIIVYLSNNQPFVIYRCG